MNIEHQTTKAMNTYTMENTVAGIPIQLHSYDVLLSVGSDTLSFAPGNHVGNQRFRVLLSIFRQRYLQADMFGDDYDCTSIAKEVFETVCYKCVPNGRFFEQGRNNGWQQFDHDSPSTIAMIKNALKNEPIEVSAMERTPKRLRRADSSGFELLWNAASKELPASSQGFVASPNPFDVVCEANGLGISQDRKHTGNNRLKIMFDMRMNIYKASTEKGKQMVAEEFVSSIIDDASGHFLQVDKPSDTFKVISRTLATACVRTALDTPTGVKKIRESEVKKLVQRKHKKAILDRVEKRKGAGINFFSCYATPTTFNKVSKLNGVVSKAA